MPSNTDALSVERRSATRMNASLKVYLSGKRSSVYSVTQDISRRGVFVKSQWSYFPIGSHVDLTFVMKKMEIIKVKRYSCIIVRNSRAGMALRFTTVPPTCRLANVAVAP